MSANLLDRETSPYLLQHKDNPVHWQPWGEDALERARREDKPILLSVGYAACHWCHVMAHESFENDAIASLMNEHFVNIKVDREERPDIDAIYQSALMAMGEHGGWPLTMFLTPDGTPFWGGTYFPPAPKFGRRGFPQVLEQLSVIYRDEREKVNHNCQALREAIEAMARPAPGGRMDMAAIDEAARAALQVIDFQRGGTMGAPKFPQPALFRFVWHARKRLGDARLGEAVTLTLDNLCQGGIYDHVGGGFARYATDAEWLVPHFEKMLYDNALLVELMAEVWRDTRSPLYATRVAETVDWMLRDMRGDTIDGAFAFTSALDADSEGEEGRYYVWTDAEVRDVLGDDADDFNAVYGVTPGGNWEGKTILNRRVDAGFGPDGREEFLGRCLARLRERRAGRVPPQRDDKVLADWNGLAIAALARAGAVFERTDWIDAAQSAFRFVVDNMQTDGRLLHAWCQGRARHPAILDDYADMARAALMLHEATGETAYRDQAERWVAVADRHYWDNAGGGYFMAADDTTDLLTRSKSVFDNAVPAGNGVMLEALARLALLTGKAAYRERAEALARAFSVEHTTAFLNQPTFAVGFEILQTGTQVVVCGEADDERTPALVRAAIDTAPPGAVLSRAGNGAGLPDEHPAAGKGPVDGRPAAYVCRGPVCGLPVTDPDALRTSLTAG